MTVVAIHLGAPRKPELWEVESVRAAAGKGLEGDRYFFADGAEPGRALTPERIVRVKCWQKDKFGRRMVERLSSKMEDQQGNGRNILGQKNEEGESRAPTPDF